MQEFTTEEIDKWRQWLNGCNWPNMMQKFGSKEKEINMAEITIRAKADDYYLQQEGYVDFCVLPKSGGMSLQILPRLIGEPDTTKFAQIGKADAIILAQTILQMYNLPFTPNPVS